MSIDDNRNNSNQISNITDMKKPEDCFLTIHNFVKINFTSLFSKYIGANDVRWNTTQNFKTYIYSFTRPYIIELIQNSTENCLCCT